MYAMLLEGIMKEKIWGGNHLKSFGKKVGNKNIGESWEVACHDHGVSRIRNGRYKGLTLKDLMSEKSHDIFQNEMKDFPLMIKYIDANDDLSLQVHPDDHYSKMLNQPFGKTEAWYIIEAEEGAEIILGTHDEDLVSLNKHIDSFEEIYYTNHIKVRAGEMYFVPAGTIHAIGKGIVLLEIQQNSDITYRIFDYNRDRELQLEEAKKVVNLHTNYKKCEGNIFNNDTYILTRYIDEPEFTIEKIDINNQFVEESENHDFQLINCIDGSGIIYHSEGETVFKKGDSILIPSKLGKYRIVAYATVIRTYISKRKVKEVQ